MKAKVDNAKNRLEKYHGREGFVKSQIIICVWVPSLDAWEEKTTKETWEALVAKMTKKPKMVITLIQRQLQNMKFSEDGDLREHLEMA